MASHGSGEGRCPDTGLSVPECSCRRCLVAMLERFQPELLVEEIKVSRLRPQRRRAGRRRPAA